MGAAPWAILDFPGPDGRPVREVFREPIEIVEARTDADVRPALDRVERLARSDLTLVGFVAYEAAPGLETKFQIRHGHKGPLVWFLAGQPEAPAAEMGAKTVPVEAWTPKFDGAAYKARVGEIIEGIERGDHYQVNLTERFSARIANPLAVFERLRAAQDAKYSAYVETAEMAVLSVSPELFVHRSGNLLESRPMKGTARRGRWSDEDDVFARRLAASEKERAENVMIVDLIRNDMGRIAIPGSVEVPEMFTIERYPTVFQMTSHVKSQLRLTTTLADVFTALFPCGSVTGAPKIAASKAIAALEATPRGVYCGAVGVVRPGGVDFTFNVAIRTVAVDTATGEAIYGAGGGITSDSDPDRELDELRAKAAVLTSMPTQTELLETLRLDRGSAVRLELHLDRLRRSAEYFGFASVGSMVSAVRQSIHREAGRHPAGVHRLRVLASPDGGHSVTVQPFEEDVGPRRLAIAAEPIRSEAPRLYHKVADRRIYSESLAAAPGADDVVLVNERGEITETTIGNLVLELDGRRVTPSLDCGLLPGVFRGVLLAAGQVSEAVLYPSDLSRATRIWMVNSLREWVPCRLH